MKRRPNVRGGGLKAPPAPAAPGVRNNTGIAGQARTGMTKKALQNNRPSGGVRPGGGAKPNRGPSGGVRPGKGPKGRFGGGKKTPWHKEQEKKRQAQAEPPAPPVDAPAPEPAAPAPQPDPYADGNKVDPRTPEYWANRTAIDAQFDAEILAIDAEGQRAETSFNQEGMALAEYNRLRKRNLGESRLGTGSAYSGNAQRDQLENDLEYTINEGRRFRDKQSADAARQLDRGRLDFQRDAAIRELDEKTAAEMAEGYEDESINSAGDAGLPEEGGGEEETTGPSKPKGPTTRAIALGDRLKKQNKRLKTLQQKKKNAETPKQKQNIQKTINKVKQNRTQTKGALNKERKKK